MDGKSAFNEILERLVLKQSKILTFIHLLCLKFETPQRIVSRETKLPCENFVLALYKKHLPKPLVGSTIFIVEKKENMLGNPFLRKKYLMLRRKN